MKWFPPLPSVLPSHWRAVISWVCRGVLYGGIVTTLVFAVFVGVLVFAPIEPNARTPPSYAPVARCVVGEKHYDNIGEVVLFDYCEKETFAQVSGMRRYLPFGEKRFYNPFKHTW